MNSHEYRAWDPRRQAHCYDVTVWSGSHNKGDVTWVADWYKDGSKISWFDESVGGILEEWTGFKIDGEKVFEGDMLTDGKRTITAAWSDEAGCWDSVDDNGIASSLLADDIRSGKWEIKGHIHNQMDGN